ncbi:MAG: hypothetical protein ACI4LA_03340 [Emergencia sp.]
MKKFKMPTALTIVMLFLLIVVILTWFVPTSVSVTGEDGSQEIIYNAAFDADGNIIENAGTDPAGLWDFIMAPIRGFADAVEVALSIFVSGGLLAVLAYTGALDAGIGRLLNRFQGSVLIAVLMLVFALMGAVYGAWEELPAYAIAVIPLFVTAGYDVMTGILVIILSATIGNMASIVNPYSVGAAVAAIGNPDLSMGSGIALRIILFAVMYAMAAFFVIRYANKVKFDPSRSCTAGLTDINTMVHGQTEKAPEMTGRQKWSLVVFGLVIVMCVMGYIPWDSIPVGDGTAFDYVNGLQYKIQGTFIGNLLGADSFTEFAWWYFIEFSVVWTLGAIVIAVINKMPERVFVEQFVKGAADLTGVVFVLAAARGIALIMGSREYGMSITFIYWIQNLISDVPIWLFAVAGVLVYMLIGIFLQTTSGVSGITMPLFGAIAMALFAASDAGAVGGQVLLISAFTVGLNFISGFYPGSTVMGIIEMVNVPYDIYVKQIMRYLIPILLAAVVIISAAPYIGLV